MMRHGHGLFAAMMMLCAAGTDDRRNDARIVMEDDRSPLPDIGTLTDREPKWFSLSEPRRMSFESPLEMLTLAEMREQDTKQRAIRCVLTSGVDPADKACRKVQVRRRKKARKERRGF